MMCRVQLLLASCVYLASATPGAPAQYAGYQADYKTYEDYKKEMESAGKGAMNYTAFTKAYEKYQQFMDYLHKEGSHSPVNFHKFLADYEKYMDFKSYVGKGAHRQEDQAHNFKDFLNFEQYLQYSSKGGSGDYNKYFSGVQFDALDKATKGSDDDVGSSDTQSILSNFGGGNMGHGFVPSGTTDGGPKGGLPAVTNDFRQYMDYSKYMGISHQYTQKDWMSEWQKFQQEGSQDQQVPYSPKDCKTEKELNAWKDKQTKIAKTWIPSMYQEPTLSSIDKEYKDNLERIKHPESQDAAVPQPEPVMLSKEAPAPQPRAVRPSAAGARSTQTATELVAWRGQMGAMVETLPAKEQAEWNAVLDGEMEAAFKRLGAGSETGDVQLLATKVPAAVKSSNFSRTLLAFVVSFSMPVAGMYIYRAIKQVPGTDLDARFLAADGEA